MSLKSLLRAIPIILLSATIGTSMAASKAKDSATPDSAAAASATPGAPAKKRTVSPEAKAKGRLTRLKNQAGLTPDQEAKAKPIIDKYVADRDLAKGDKAKLVALKTQYDSDIDKILTPDQQKKVAASKSASMAKLKAGRAAKATASPTPAN
jgi:hypothetical protein